jgi:magnesium transporter
VIRSVFRYIAGVPAPVDDVITQSTPGAVDPDLIRTLAEESRREARRDIGSFTWIKVQDPTSAELKYLSEIFNLTQLQVDDAQNPRQRPKLEIDRSVAFLILKELRYVDATSDVETGQVSVFVGRGFAISIRHGDAAPGSSRARLAREPSLLANGPISVLYAVADVIVDGYLDISNALESDVSQIEDAVFSRESGTATLIYQLKRENLELRRALAPIAWDARQATRQEHSHVPEAMEPYFADVGDHILRAYELADSHDQLLMAMLMAETSQQELRQNADMRKISAWAAIIAIPTAIAGIYGMNFENMPGLETTWGYPITLAAMATICLVLFRTFKRYKWL